MISTKDTYRPAPKVAHRAIGGRVAIVKPHEKRFITLNETASFIWTHLETETVASLAERVSGAFEVSSEDATADVLGFIEKLLSNGLIALKPAPGEPAD